LAWAGGEGNEAEAHDVGTGLAIAAAISIAQHARPHWIIHNEYFRL
jgi:hypothetical protein